MLVPCLLRNSDSEYEELTVVSDEYYPVKVRLKQPHTVTSLHLRNGANIFYVKKRHSYTGDAPLALTAGGQESDVDNPDLLVSTYDSNRYLRAYAKYLLRQSDPDYYERALQDCVAEDAEEALRLYLALLPTNKGCYGIVKLGDGGVAQLPQTLAWDLRLIRTYYRERHRFVGGSNHSKRLLNVDLLLAYLHEVAERGLATDIDTGEVNDQAARFALSFYDDF